LCISKDAFFCEHIVASGLERLNFNINIGKLLLYFTLIFDFSSVLELSIYFHPNV
jgi:hypothetical protein